MRRIQREARRRTARHVGDPDVAAAMAVTMATNAAAEPTERSNWPLISNRVAGQATIPMRAVFWRMLIRLALFRKYCDVIEKKMTRTASTAKMAMSSAR